MTFHKYLADSKMFEYDKHYRECQQQNKPFIKSKINPLHGNYSVNVDLMTCDYVFSKLELNEIIKLIHDEKKFVNSNLSTAREKNINGVPFFEIGKDFISGAQSSIQLENVIKANLN